MQVSAQKVTPVLLELDVEVGIDRVQQEVDKAYQELAKRAKIRGFRPGKAPRQVLIQVFGSRVRADVAQKLVDATYPDALGRQNVQTVSEPVFESSKLTENAPFSYKARVEVLPEIAQLQYEGLAAHKPDVTVTDEKLAARLEQLRQQNSTLEPVTEPRPAAAGDVLTLDLEVEFAGKSLPEAASKDLQVELGTQTVLPELEQALLGAQLGQAIKVETTFPSTHPSAQFRGKRATLTATLKELKCRILPPLDDEFAKDLGEYETLEELRAALSDEIRKELELEATNRVAEQLVVELVKANPIDVPPSLVQRQAQITERELVQQASRNGQPMKRLPEELRANLMKDSELKVRAGLLMAEIAKREGLKIGDKEINEGLEELAEQTGKNVAKLRAEYREASKREMLVGMILENKVLDIIESKAKIEGA